MPTYDCNLLASMNSMNNSVWDKQRNRFVQERDLNQSVMQMCDNVDYATCLSIINNF